MQEKNFIQKISGLWLLIAIIAIGFLSPVSLFATNVVINLNNTTTTTVLNGTTNAQILQVAIEHLGGGAPHDALVTTMSFTPDNTTNTDVLCAKLFYTTSASFSSSTQLGNTDSILSDGISFNFSQGIARASSGYFWLTYDLLSCDAGTGDTLDATQVLTDITVSEPVDSFIDNATSSCIIVNGGCWTKKADFGGFARAGAVGFSIGTKGYIGTGSDSISSKKDFWEWDQGSNSWMQKADFGGSARNRAVGFSIGTKGYIGTGSDTANLKDFWEFDPSLNTWTQKNDFGGVARSSAVSFSLGTKGYIGTGFNGTYMKDFWEYDPASDIWTQKTDFGGTGRDGAVGFSIGTKGYIGTGTIDGLNGISDFWEWEQIGPPGGTWSQRANFPTQRMYGTGFSIGNKGYIGTGWVILTVATNDLYEWDQASNTWIQKADFEDAIRYQATGFAIGDWGYIGTGVYSSSDYYNSFWEYWNSANTTYSIITLPLSGSLYCQGESFLVDYSVSGTIYAGNIFSAQLSDSLGNFSSPVNIGSVNSTTNISISVTIPTNTVPGIMYRIRIISSNPNITGSDNGADIAVNQNYVVNSSALICAGDSIFLQSAFQTTAGTYYDTLSSVNGCDSVIATALTIYPTLTVSNMVATCSGDNTIFMVSFNIIGGDSTSYFVTGGTGTLNGNLFTSDSIPSGNSYSFTATDTYNCSPQIVSGSQNCTCPASATVTGGGTACSGMPASDIVFTLYGTAPWDLTYNINGIPQTPLTGITISPYTITNPSVGIYTVASISDSICTGSGSGNAIVSINPTFNEPVSTSICSGDSIFLQGAYQIFAGTYYDSLASMNGCDSVITTTLTVNPLPPADAGNSVLICSGDSAQLNASGGAVYLWYPGNFLNDSLISNPFAFPVNTTIFYVTVVSANGCSNSDSVVISVSPNPTPTISGTSSFCQGDSVLLTSSSANSYLWDNGATSQSIIVNNSGIYTVTVTDSIGCSGTSLPVTITAYSPPSADFTSDITSGCFPQTINFSDLSVDGDTNIIFWDWNLGDGTTSFIQNPVAIYSFPGVFSVSLKVIDAYGCYDSIVNLNYINTNQCGQNLSGTIYKSDNITEITSGKVFLVDYDTAIIQFTFLDSFNLNGTNGNYIFSNAAVGEYLILVKPNSANYPNTIPTYYGDTAFWKGATILNIISDTAGINIAVTEFPAFSGNGYISGIIQYGIGTGKTGNGNVTPFGDPVPGIDISLEEIPGGIIRAHTETNDSGFYSFSNLPLNSTFKLLVDIPGLPMDSSYSFTIAGIDTVYNNLDFVVDTSSDGSAGIYIGHPLSTPDLRLSTYDFFIFPNPNDGKFTIQLNNLIPQSFNNSIAIYNILGEIIFSDKLLTSITLHQLNLSSGIYNVKVASDRGFANRKVIIE